MLFVPPSHSRVRVAAAFCSESCLVGGPRRFSRCLPFSRYVDLSMNMFRGTLPKFGSVVSARPASLNLDDVSVCRK